MQNTMVGWNGLWNRNNKQLEHNACMLAPEQIKINKIKGKKMKMIIT